MVRWVNEKYRKVLEHFREICEELDRSFPVLIYHFVKERYESPGHAYAAYLSGELTDSRPYLLPITIIKGQKPGKRARYHDLIKNRHIFICDGDVNYENPVTLLEELDLYEEEKRRKPESTFRHKSFRYIFWDPRFLMLTEEQIRDREKLFLEMSSLDEIERYIDRLARRISSLGVDCLYELPGGDFLIGKVLERLGRKEAIRVIGPDKLKEYSEDVGRDSTILFIGGANARQTARETLGSRKIPPKSKLYDTETADIIDLSDAWV